MKNKDINMYEEALGLFQEKNFDAAIEAFKEDLEHEDSFLQLANCYFCKKEYDKALEYIDKSIEKNPLDINNAILWGLIQYEMKQEFFYAKKYFFNDLLNFIKYQITYSRTLAEKLMRGIFDIFLIISWLLISFDLYHYIMNTNIDMISYYLIIMQLFTLFTFIIYKWTYFEKTIFIGAIISLLALVIPLMSSNITFLPILLQAIGFTCWGGACLVEKDVILEILNLKLLTFIENYISIENYHTALNICNIVISNTQRNFIDLTKYQYYKQKIEKIISL